MTKDKAISHIEDITFTQGSPAQLVSQYDVIELVENIYSAFSKDLELLQKMQEFDFKEIKQLKEKVEYWKFSFNKQVKASSK